MAKVDTDPLLNLLTGFGQFRDVHVRTNSGLFQRLAREGQSPKVMVVGCSDARVDPAILTHCNPGDLFVIRNVAAIVPPSESDGRHHGTSSALEFGVRGLGVEHIIVLGHSSCGGVRLLGSDRHTRGDFEFLTDWVGIAAEARAMVNATLRDAPLERRLRVLEQATILLSLRNLLTYRWIRQPVQEGRLCLHGWYFDLHGGEFLAYDATTTRFVTISDCGKAGQPCTTDGVDHCHCRNGGELRRFVAAEAQRQQSLVAGL